MKGSSRRRWSSVVAVGLLGWVLAVVGAAPAGASVVWSTGDQSASSGGISPGSSGSNPPAGDGCWVKYDPGDESGNLTGSTLWGNFGQSTQSTCQSYYESQGAGAVGARWNAGEGSTTTSSTTSTTTTTTTAPTTTTTTIPISLPAVRSARPVTDPVVRQAAVSFAACGQALYGGGDPAVAVWCGPELAAMGTTAGVGDPATATSPATDNGGWRVLVYSYRPFGNPNYAYPTWAIARSTAGNGTAAGGYCIRTSSGHYLVPGPGILGSTLNAAGSQVDRQGAAWTDPPVYGWRVPANSTGQITVDNCRSLDPGAGIPPPAVGCRRTNSGSRVGLVATVVNPREGATDTVKLRFPWESGERSGSSASGVAVPTAGMPPGGWRAYCKVTRVVAVGAGSRAYQTGAVWSTDFDDDGQLGAHPRTGDLQPVFYQVPPGDQTLPLVPVLVGVGANGAASAALGLNVPTVAGVTAAGVVGWLLGGVAISLEDWLGVNGDQEWACRWSPTYRALNSGLCHRLVDEKPYLRSIAKLGVCSTPGGGGSPTCAPIDQLSTATWTVATTIVEVLVNPLLDPRVGRVNTGAPMLPSLAPVVGADPPNVEDAVVPALSPAGVGDAPASLQTITGPEQDPTIAIVEPTDGSLNDCFGASGIGLNPLSWVPALARMVACALRSLFIPSGDPLERLKDSWAGVSSILGHPVAVINAAWSALGSGSVADCTGPAVSIPYGPAVAGNPAPTFSFSPLNNCSGVPKTVSDFVRPALLAMIWLGCVRSCYETLAEALIGVRTQTFYAKPGVMYADQSPNELW